MTINANDQMQQMVIFNQDDLRDIVKEIFAKDIEPKILAAVSKKDSEKTSDNLMTRVEMASKLRICLVTLNKLDREGLPSIKIRNRRLYDLELVKQYFSKKGVEIK